MRTLKKLLDTEQLILLQVLFNHPGICLDEVKEKMQESTGLSVSISLICIETKEHGWAHTAKDAVRVTPV